MAAKKPKAPTRTRVQSKEGRQRVWLETFEESGHTGKACEVAGITRNTYYDWRRDKGFVQLVSEAEERFLDKLEDVVRVGSEVDVRVAQTTLAARRPTVWSQKHNHQHTHDWRRDIKVVLVGESESEG